MRDERQLKYHQYMFPAPCFLPVLRSALREEARKVIGGTSVVHVASLSDRGVEAVHDPISLYMLCLNSPQGCWVIC